MNTTYYRGQLPPQYGNQYVNNKMVNSYQKTMKNNVPFGNNQMLNNNPSFFHNINDASFYHKINMEKMEKMKRIKNVDELGLSKEKLTEFIICPIKVEKENKIDLLKKFDIKETFYINPTDKKAVTDSILNLWSGRNNNPYKNILKNENYKKKFTNKEDLIVHKVTTLDKNLIKTLAEFDGMLDFIEIHNGELKIKYSDKKKDKYKDKFDYENKIKYRVKYDPKNYNELKKFYKKEHEKIKKANKRVDEMIEMLLVSENFTKEELEEIQKPSENEDSTQITMVFEKNNYLLEKELEEQLENELMQELSKELGHDKFKTIMKKYDDDTTKKTSKHKNNDSKKYDIDDDNNKNSKNIENNSDEKMLKVKKIKSNQTDNDEIIKSKPLIMIKTKKNNNLSSEQSIKQNDSNESNKSNDLNEQNNLNNLNNINKPVEPNEQIKKRITLKSKKTVENSNVDEIQKPKENQIGYVNDDEIEEFKRQKKTKK